jgi:hypothetical protein
MTINVIYSWARDCLELARIRRARARMETSLGLHPYCIGSVDIEPAYVVGRERSYQTASTRTSTTGFGYAALRHIECYSFRSAAIFALSHLCPGSCWLRGCQ